MAWYVLLLIQVGLQILSGLLTSKGAKPEKNLDLPHVDASTPIPVPFGRVLIKDPMLLDYLDFKTEAIKIRNPATFFITTITTGYNYYIGMVFGVCWGIVDHDDAKGAKLLEILIDNRTAWSPSGTAPKNSGNGILNGSSSPIIINQPSFFGSEKQEGGVRVEGYWYTGADLTFPSTSNQTVNSYWQTQRGVSMPNYKDVAYFVWHGPTFGNLSPTYGGKKSGLIGNAPRLWPLAFKVSRYPRTLTEGVFGNEVSDIPFLDSPPIDSYVHGNPIEALYECLTSDRFGASINPAHIFTTLGGGTDLSFADAASECYLEGLAFDYLWTSSSPVEEMIAEILRYVDAAIWTDPADGLIKIKLARNDYAAGSLPSFSNDDFLEIASFTRGSWRETKSEVRISFPDQSKADYEMNTATWRNPANYQIQGANEPAEITFRGCPSMALASRLAAREGRVLSTPLARLRGTIDRKAWLLHPCSVFKFSWPEHGITDLIMRVTTMNLGTLLEGTIEIQAVEDVFAAGSATYSPGSSTIWTDPLGGAAQDSPYASAGEVPYWMQRDATPRAFGVASRPSSAHPSYDGSLDSAVDVLAADFTPTGTLSAALDQLSATDYDTVGFVVGSCVDPDLVEAGDTTTIPAEGASLAIIGDPAGIHEWIAFESVAVAGTDMTLDNVWRGLLDTPPRDWPTGTRVYFFAAGSSLFTQALADAQAVTFEALTRTMRDQLLAADATNHSETMQSRALRPLPPYYVRMGGSYTNETQATGDLVFTWREHSRLTALDIIKQSATTTAAEAGVTYEIDIYAADGVTVLRNVTGLSSPTYTYTNADELSDSGSSSLQNRLRLEFFSKRDGLRSLYPWIRNVYRSELQTVAGVSSASGSLSVNFAVSGEAASVSTASGSLAGELAMSGTAESTSTASGDLTNESGLTLELWLAPHMESFADNDAVGTLTDQSGNGRDFTQGTAANKPTFKTNILNSQPAVRFDGSNDFLEGTAFVSGDAEFFAVLRIPTGIGSSNWGWQKFSGHNSLSDHFTFFGTAYSTLGGTDRTNYSVNSATAEAGMIVHIVVKGGTNNWKWYENGNVEKAAMTQTISWGTSRHLVGASSGNSDASSISAYFNGWLLELRIYSGTLDSTQRNNVLAEINSTFGISYTSF